MREPFRPQRGRLVAIGFAVVAVLVFGVVAMAMPGDEQGGNWKLGDRLMLLGLGVAIAALLIRYARIVATPTETGLRVRNLFLTRTIPWSEIEAIRFGGGEPWVTLDLTDGDSIAVMAIQRADGPRGVDEAQRLADLAGPAGAPTAR